MSMVVVLPKEKGGIGSLEQSMNEKEVGAWLGPLDHVRVEVTFPRFSFSAALSLARVLSEMGMSGAFSCNQADFSAIDGTRELFLPTVVHKAFVKVEEKGTEAAAATASEKIGSSGLFRPPKPRTFRADHPFLFFIKDIKSGGVLFMGRVVD